MKITWMEHQQRAIDYISEHRATALFFETGTGKTPIGLWTAEFWYHKRNLRRIIAIVPNSLTGNWVEESENFNCTLRWVRAEGNREQRIAQLESLDWDVFVLNYECARTIWPNIVAINPQGLIMDEIQRVKDRRAAQTKAARAVAATVKREDGCTIGLTGSPIVKWPLDLWSEFDVLWPGAKPTEHVLGYGNYWAFESQVCNKSPHPRLGNRVPLYRFPEEKVERLRVRVAPLSLEAAKADCLDLPPVTYQPVKLDLTDEQQTLYNALREDYVAFLEDRTPSARTLQTLSRRGVSPIGNSANPDAIFLPEPGDTIEDSSERRISVAFATTLLIRLQQITSGFVKTDDGAIVDIDNAKLDWCAETLPDICSTIGDHKSVIFCRYTHELDLLATLAAKLKIGFVTLSGKNSGDASKIVKDFQTNPKTRLFIGNVQVSSVGITLTAGDYSAFYSNSFAYGDRIQAVARLDRIGQSRPVTISDLIARRTIDEQVLRNLNEKRTLANLTLTSLRQML